MRGAILGATGSAIGGAIMPRDGTAAALPVWSIAGATQITEEAANAVYTVSYANALSPGQSATIRVASAAGTASDGVDYTGVATTLTFTGGGATSKTLAATIIEDTTVEGTEDFLLTLASQSTGTIAGSQVNTAIADDDVATFLLDAISGTAVQAYSMRKLRAAYAGNCLRLRRSSDNAESDFGFDGSGNLDMAAIATWLGGATGFVVTWYDQSGNGDSATQATAAEQPTYVASGINSLPTVDFIPNTAFVMTGPSAHPTWTTFAVVIYETVGTTGHIIGNSTTNRQHRLRRSTTKVDLFAGATLSLNYGGDWTVPHLFEWENRGSNVGEVWVEGSSLGTGDPGTGTLNCTEFGRLGTIYFDGKMTEVIVFGANLSGGDRAIAEADIMAYWGL